MIIRLTRPLLLAVLMLTWVEALHLSNAAAASGVADLAEAALQTKLLQPLQKKEEDRSRFSRAALPPQARRVRILDETTRTDPKGRPFVAFAIDEKRAFGIVKETDGAEADWFQNSITGCIYPASGAVMVKRGEAYYASSVLLGRPTPVGTDDVCRTR